MSLNFRRYELKKHLQLTLLKVFQHENENNRIISGKLQLYSCINVILEATQRIKE